MVSDPTDPYQYLDGFDVQNYPCKKGETRDDCNKRQFEQRGLAACKVCAAIFTAGTASSLCNDVNPIVAKLIWPLVSWIEAPVSDLVNAVIGLANAISAQPVFDPGYESWKMWIGGQDGNSEDQGPVVIYWRKAVSAIEEAWNKMRVAKGLPPAPVKISSEMLFKAAKAIWKKPERMRAVNVAKKSDVGDLVGEVIGGVIDTPPWLKAEDALAMFCYQDETPASGWAVQAYQLGFFNSKTGWVISNGNNGGKVLGFYQGTGPFAINRYLYWDEVCQDNCLAQFRNAVATLWGMRLACVRRALPGLLAVINAQLDIEKNAGTLIISSAGKLGPITAAPSAVSGAAIATASVVTVAAGAGAGILAVKLIQLLFGR